MGNKPGSLSLLVATDGSRGAIAAARRAVELFGPTPHVVLVTVVGAEEDPEADAGGFEGPLLTEEEAQAEWNERRAEASDELARTASALSIDPEIRMIPSEGDPGTTLTELARTNNADVIVVGGSTKSALARFFSKSVSDYLVHHAPCPVLVVRGDHLGSPSR